MANISRLGLLAGSDPALKRGPYGPNLKVEKTGDLTSLTTEDGSIIAQHVASGGGEYFIHEDRLTPLTVPYVNAFVRDTAVVDKYWRTGTYRVRPVTGCTATAIPGHLFHVTGHPTVTASVAGGYAPAPVVIAPAPKAKRTPKAKAAPVVAPKVRDVIEGTVAPTPLPVVTKRGKKATSGIKAPAGYVIVAGRSGELVVPERTLQTFAAAVGARFEDGLPAHVLVIGPAGTGKTESVLALAVQHGMEIAGVVQCGGIEGPSDLYGQTAPDETAPHGWRRLPSALWLALDLARNNPEKRYFALLDEVNRVGTISAQNSLLGLLDGTEALSNPATGETIPLPPNLMIGATANIGVAYSGTVRIDAALMSRWWTNLSFGYLPENVETAIAKAIIGNAEQARYLARAAAELRKAHTVDEFRSALIPGTREIVAVAYQAKRDPTGVAGAWHDKVTCSFSNEGRDPSRTEYARVRVLAEAVFKNPLEVERPAEDSTPF